MTYRTKSLSNESLDMRFWACELACPWHHCDAPWNRWCPGAFLFSYLLICSLAFYILEQCSAFFIYQIGHSHVGVHHDRLLDCMWKWAQRAKGQTVKLQWRGNSNGLIKHATVMLWLIRNNDSITMLEWWLWDHFSTLDDGEMAAMILINVMIRCGWGSCDTCDQCHLRVSLEHGYETFLALCLHEGV